MIKRAVFTGTFDPITKGHVHIIQRGLKLFDEVIIAISYNEHKQTLLTLQERVDLVTQSFQHDSRVKVVTHSGGLSVDLAKQLNAQAIIKGVRNVQDFEYEQSMALYGKRHNSMIETVLLVTDEPYKIISSSGVKEYFRVGGNIRDMVESHVLALLQQKIPVESVVYNAD